MVDKQFAIHIKKTSQRKEKTKGGGGGGVKTESPRVKEKWNLGSGSKLQILGGGGVDGARAISPKLKGKSSPELP